MKNWSNTKALMMMKSENLRFVMDETGRPYEPVEPEYERGGTGDTGIAGI